MASEENTFFNVDSRLLFQLGEKLVTNRAVALGELIKNSYDADATRAIVRMENIKNPGGTIIVEDNGTGMTALTFQRTWMRIATIDKEENPISAKYNRQKAGEKGIGRFACRKLSSRLLLKSVAETGNGSKEELNAIFDWATFIPGSDLDKTPINYTVISVDAKTPTGTTLTLENTTESWNALDIRLLRIELMDLISPTTFRPESEFAVAPEKYDPGFLVDFECSEFPVAFEQLDETFFKNAWAKLTGSVDDKGHVSYEIKVINAIMNKLERTFERDKAFEYLRSAELEVYIFSYRGDLFEHSEWGLNKAERIGQERGGVKVYADNFRVFGYGAKGDDWLAVDYDRARSRAGVDTEVRSLSTEDKRPGLRLFRNENLFGHVTFVRQDNPGLDITVNRERLLESATFNELKRFTRLGIDFATVLYANEVVRELKAIEERRKAKEEARKKTLEEARRKEEESLREAEEEQKKAEERKKQLLEEAQIAEQERLAAEETRRLAENDRRAAEEEARRTNDKQAWQRVTALLNKERELFVAEEKARAKEQAIKQQVEEAIRTAEKERETASAQARKVEEDRRRIEELELKRKDETYTRELSLLRVLASTGTLILIFEHELQALVEDMEEMISSTLAVLKKLPDVEQTDFKYVLDSFSNRTEMIKELGEFLGLTIGKESRLEKREWVLHPLVESVFSPFRQYFKDFGIDHRNTIPDNLRTPKMYRSEVVSVLHNLMSNATKAVKGQHQRLIEVTGFEENGRVHIQFLDSGKGLDESRWMEAFEPFESDSEPDLRLGSGTGLGLKIARDIIRAYGGDIRFITPPSSWKTCVEITLPQEV
jgi:signal transduction histidine kinase